MMRHILMTILVFPTLSAWAGVSPMIDTQWGQGAPYNTQTPMLHGEHTYPGCTSIATAQILRYYAWRDHGNGEVFYQLDNQAVGNGEVYVDLEAHRYDFAAMSDRLDGATDREIRDVATFIFHVAAALNAQFDLGDGSSASGKQVENAFRYAFGYNNKPRREMYIALKETADGYQLYRDNEWEAMVRAELDASRPVLHMAKNAEGAGHAFIIDGYNDQGLFHVNWGWAGHADGWYDLHHLQPSGSSSVWNREAMIFVGLEPEAGYAATLQPGGSSTIGEQRQQELVSTVSAGEWVHYGPFEAIDGTFEVEMTGTGDADLYVRADGQPTENRYDCRPYEEGSDETCSLQAPGTFYVSVNGYAPVSDFSLTIRWQASEGETPIQEGIDLIIDDVSLNRTEAAPGEVIAVSCRVLNQGSVAAAAGRMKYYLSNDQSFDDGDRYLNYDNVAALAGGAASEENANLRIPANRPAGAAWLLFVADTTETSNELDEGNNVVAVPITIR